MQSTNKNLIQNCVVIFNNESFDDFDMFLFALEAF